jgi:hypothetical protein
MNYLNMHDVSVRSRLLATIEDSIPSTGTTKLEHHAVKLAGLAHIVSGYDFVYSYGSIRLNHSFSDRDGRSTAWLLNDLNRIMIMEMRYYDIPYLITFVKGTYTYDVDIVKLDAIDPKDELIEALAI